MDINNASFQPIVEIMTKFSITPSVLIGVLSLVGDETVTADSLYKAWTLYQQSAAYRVLRAA